MKLTLIVSVLIVICIASSPVHAWNDATHMAVMKAAGLDDYAYLAVGPDMAKLKSGGHEEGNHYCNNQRGTVVTADLVLDQAADYNCRCPGGKGHLYGSIVAAAHQYLERKQQGKYWRYELGFLAHYVADLSMPLHNVEYNEFNRMHHSANDGAVEPERYAPTGAKVARIAAGIREAMKRHAPYQLPPAAKDLPAFDLQLAARIAEIANKATALGYSMQESQPQRPVMNQDEAYRQLAQSALLLKAIYSAIK